MLGRQLRWPGWERRCTLRARLTRPPDLPARSCYRERLGREPAPDAATQAKLDALLGWLSRALQLLSLLLQHGGQMEAFLDDGGVMSLCLHLAKYPAIHAQLPPTCAPPRRGRAAGRSAMLASRPRRVGLRGACGLAWAAEGRALVPPACRASAGPLPC